MKFTKKEQELIDKAKLFAQKSHDGQKRKYTNEPYFSHCQEVADILLNTEKEATAEMVAAAYLHDVLEDTDCTYAKLLSHIGKEVSEMVFELTDLYTTEDGNRAERKKKYREYIWHQDQKVQTIKCCDIISNAKDIWKYDAKFAKVYLPECLELLLGMECWERSLLTAKNIVRLSMDMIGIL